MRLIHTLPIHRLKKKAAATPSTVQALSGRLFLSESGWLLLAVPNAIVRGHFDALDEPGVELPLKDGKLNAHVTVMRPEELEQIGGADKISERGHHFKYTTGPVRTVTPAGWDEISKVWFLNVKSNDLQKLRRSYGLSAKPKNGEHEFHITFAVRKKKVLHSNQVSKAADDGTNLTEKEALRQVQAACRTPTNVEEEKAVDAILGYYREKEALSNNSAKEEMPAEDNRDGIHALIKAAAEDDGEKKKKKPVLQDWRTLASLGPAAAVGGLGGAALAPFTDTEVPMQVTRFPTRTRPDVIRGLIAPGEPASTIESTGGRYLVSGSPELSRHPPGSIFPRAHIFPQNVEDLVVRGRELLRGGNLELLELDHHGSPFHQQVGSSGWGTENIQAGPQPTTPRAGPLLASLPWARNNPNSRLLLGGCEAGICNLPGQENWVQQLADHTGVTTAAPRGVLRGTPVTGRVDETTFRDDPNAPEGTPDLIDETAQPGEWALHHPGQDVRQIVSHKPGTSRESSFWLPSSRATKWLYNMGRPASIGGAIGAPLFSDETNARRLALAATVAASPMALAEIATRLGESAAKLQTGTADRSAIPEYAGNQLKALPYVGMASLPMLSYGLAKLMGRWRKKEKKKD